MSPRCDRSVGQKRVVSQLGVERWRWRARAVPSQTHAMHATHCTRLEVLCDWSQCAVHDEPVVTFLVSPPTQPRISRYAVGYVGRGAAAGTMRPRICTSARR